jgi:two-component system OmpR family response regulator
MKVLVAEDEQDTQQLLAAFFRGKGCQVVLASDGEQALRAFERETPDLMLLDIRMPRLNGWEVLQRVRRDAVTPIIVVSALDSSADAVKGLGLGADDYLRKPFDLSELDARVQAVMRRSRPEAEEEAPLRVGPVEVDDLAKSVRVNGRQINLSPREYHLLRLLVSEPGRVFSHQDIIDRVWPPENRADTSDVKQYIHLLRSKIEQDPSTPCLIQTVKGFGYKLAL